MGSDPRKSILMRAYLVYVMVLIFGVLIIGKIAYIQWVQGSYWEQQAESLILRYENVEAKRGNIYGEGGSLLATSSKIFDIGMDINPKVVPDSIFFRDVDSLAICMGRLFGEPSSYFLDRLTRARKRFAESGNAYVFLRRDVTYPQLRKLRTFPIFRLGRFKGGLVIDAREVRERPYGSLARRTIGYVRLARYEVILNFGKAGIPEATYQKYADTLSLCLFNLFHDGNKKETYRKLLDQSYIAQKPVRRQINSRQLERLQKFPLVEDMDESNGLTVKKLEEEYKIGLEGSFDKLLCGRDGTRLVQKMGAGAWKVVSDENLVEPMNGLDIHTSIDVNLQDVAENALRKSLDSTNAQWGCCVLMEVKTGLIKAIANLEADPDGQYYEKLNNAIRQPIEPGSTFKLAAAIAVLEKGKFDTATVVPTGNGRVGYRIVNDAYPQGYGYVSFAKAFEKSSNRGISFLTYESFSDSINEFRAYLKKMGLYNSLGLEISGEPAPKMKFRYGDLETVPYGYVVKLTPMQILAFYNAVANDGVMVRPRFVKAIGRAGEIFYETRAQVLEPAVCSKETLRKVRKMLEGVVERGTAYNVHDAACKIAGKTGTARIYQDTGYVNRYVASFAGYFPADQPEYSCIVVLYGTSGNEYSGGQLAAPVFREVADKVYASRLDLPPVKRKTGRNIQAPLAGVARQKDLSVVYDALHFRAVSENVNAPWATSERRSDYVQIRPRPLGGEGVPDVKGMSVKDAVYVIEKHGYRTRIHGAGRVISQKPAAGSRPGEGSVVEIQLGL